MQNLKKFKCTQIELYAVCTQGWSYCQENLPAFTAIKAKYTAAFVAERLAEVESVSRMPNNSHRAAGQSLLRLTLKQEATKVLRIWKKLRRNITEAWPGEESELRLKSAGETSYRDAYNLKWESCLELIVSADSFVKDNKETLIAGNNMTEVFAAEIEAQVSAYRNAYTNYLSSLKDGEQNTGKKLDACNKLYSDLRSMFEDARTIFTDNPLQMKQFNFSSLLTQISGSNQAGIKGIISAGGENLSDIAGLELTIEESGQTADIEDDGSYRFSPLAAGNYTLVLKAEGYQTRRIPVTVNTGINSMVNVELIKAEDIKQ